MSYDDIPTAFDVFQDDDKVANAYCAVKWFIWQVAYLVVSVLLAVVVPIIVVLGLTAYLCLLPFIVLKDWGVEAASNSPRTQITKEKLATKKENIRETPGARRIYNECPVSLKTGPRWFAKITDWLDDNL